MAEKEGMILPFEKDPAPESARKEVPLPSSAKEFLTKLEEGDVKFENNSQIAIVVAHQDDESIGFGAQIPKMPNCLVIHVTDGAPESEEAWKKRGCKSREEYAAIRSREAEIALDYIGHTGIRKEFGVIDQQAASYLVEIALRLADLFEKNSTRFVLTHAYEGGHPDHDAVAFSVYAAKKILENRNRGATINIIEAPLYRMEIGDSIRQRFVPYPEAITHTFPLTAAESFDKSMMFDSHRSQKDDIFNRVIPHKVMSTQTEWAREAPAYNFTELPNKGNLSGIFASAGITSDRWLELTKDALLKLKL